MFLPTCLGLVQIYSSVHHCSHLISAEFPEIKSGNKAFVLVGMNYSNLKFQMEVNEVKICKN